MVSKASLAVAAALFLSVAAGQPCFAKGPHKNPCGFKHEGPHPRCVRQAMDELDLTDAQQQALDALKDETCVQIEPLVNRLQAIELYDTLSATEINEAEAAEKIAEIVELKSQIGTIKLNSRLEASKILTSEQRQQLADSIEECAEQPPARRFSRKGK